MQRVAPARVGDPVQDVDTPALLVDLDALARNLETMAAFARQAKIRVRPHAKSHKCVALARLQMAAGAVGICVQKGSEAEPFALGGIRDVLVTNQVVGDRKLSRLAALAAHSGCRVGVCVDDAANVDSLAGACAREGASLDVYVELDVGQKRAGVVSSEEVVELARAIAQHERLRLRGIHAYLGAAQHRRPYHQRREAILFASELAHGARAALLAAALPCDIVTGAGTGTFAYETASGVYDEIQPGSYALMDADYAKNERDPHVPGFEHSLFLLSSVTSVRPREGRAALDVGLKAQSVECGPASPLFDGWSVKGVHDEHTLLAREGQGPMLRVGDKVRLIPGHVDPTVNLHDWFVVVQNDRVVEVWPIEARGLFF